MYTYVYVCVYGMHDVCACVCVVCAYAAESGAQKNRRRASVVVKPGTLKTRFDGSAAAREEGALIAEQGGREFWGGRTLPPAPLRFPPRVVCVEPLVIFCSTSKSQTGGSGEGCTAAGLHITTGLTSSRWRTGL